MDGIQPEGLRIQELLGRLSREPITEIILAINPTVEGDTTMLYLMEVLRQFPVKVSKLAYGLPMGSDIEYADELTLQKAFQGRAAL